jgi:hypothetical protein
LTLREACRPVRAQQVQCQVDRWPPFGDVVLQIGLDPLVAQVQLGSQSEHKDPVIKIREVPMRADIFENSGSQELLNGIRDIGV